jgi:monoamine oxidase
MPRSNLMCLLGRMLRPPDQSPSRPGTDPRDTVDRRTFIGQSGRLAAAAAIAAATPGRLWAARPAVTDVGIVGAGLAGLACADALAQAGVAASVYEAGTRAGGRCWSLGGLFPGQIVERGGELIDNLHKTMLGYVKRFGLTREDVNKRPGEVFYVFAGAQHPESAVVEEFRALVDAMRGDVRRTSGSPTALAFTPYDAALDAVSLADYLDGRNARSLTAGPLARAAIVAAFEAEYGLAAADQSVLNFLLFIQSDRRSKFTPFGVFSDERFHVVEGNDRVAAGLAASLPRPVQLGRRLVRVSKRSDGRIELAFDTAGGIEVRAHEAVVLTLPFTVLRGLDLDPALGIPARQRQAIDVLGYGTNAKMMVGFTARPWVGLGSPGASYSDLAHHQATWETNYINANEERGVITDYSSGARGASLDPSRVQAEAQDFVGDLDVVYPGAAAAVRRTTAGDIVAHLEHWPSNPLVRGSYTCYRPGQFTTVAGLEGLPVGNLFFAGEHTNSFYEWQGFMEGAALSGLDAARALLKR